MKADHGRDPAGVKTHSGIGQFFTAAARRPTWEALDLDDSDTAASEACLSEMAFAAPALMPSGS